MYKLFLHVCSGLFVGVLLLALPIGVMAAENSQKLFVPSDSPYGKRFVDWAIEWWKWNSSMNSTIHPKTDHPQTDPEKCANQNQSANVWFLPNFDKDKTDYTFTCTVPQGKAIIVGNLNQGESDENVTRGDEAIRNAAMEGQIGADLKVSLDGVDQNYSMKDMRVTSDFFNLTIVKNNIYENTTAGTFKAMIDGYYIFLKPLSQGTHNLHFESKVENNPKPSLNFAQDGNWIFNVK
jgi:hypothetical protein